MKAIIRKIGNSSGAIFPAQILKKLHLSEGDAIEITENGSQILITPKQDKPKYTLDELLAKCDLKAPMPKAVKEWDEIEAVGREQW